MLSGAGSAAVLAEAGVVEDHHAIPLSQGVHQARVPCLHGSAVAHDQDQRRPAADGAVGDGAELRLRGPHRGRRDRHRAGHGARRAMLGLGHCRVSERLHRSGRRGPHVGVGEVTLVTPGAEEDEVVADQDPRDREGPGVGRGSAADRGEGDRPDRHRATSAGDGDRRRPAARQRAAQALPLPLRLRAGGQHLPERRNRRALHERGARVRVSLVIRAQAGQARRASLYGFLADWRGRPSGGQVGGRQQAALRGVATARSAASRCEQGRGGEDRRRDHHGGHPAASGGCHASMLLARPAPGRS